MIDNIKVTIQNFELFDKIKMFPDEYAILTNILVDCKTLQRWVEKTQRDIEFIEKENERLRQIEKEYNELCNIKPSADIELAKAKVKIEKLESETSWNENPERMGK